MLLIKNFTKFIIDKKFLERIVKESSENILLFKKIMNLEIDLAIVGEKRMRSLNRIWRGKDKTTDVLSFENQKPICQPDINKRKKIFSFINPLDGVFHLGEIIICAPVVARQAKEDGHSFDQEIAILLIHGILHLAGYDHEKNARDAQKMFGIQKKIINKISNQKSEI